MVLVRHAATAALLLVAFVLAADAAASRPSVSDILAGVKPSNPQAAGPQASVAANQQEGYGGDNQYTNDYAHAVETKEVCLTEVQRSQCMESLEEHYDWKSDYALCNTAKNYYSANSGVGFGAVGQTPPLNAIGSCDWHFDEGGYWFITDNIEMDGRVYATCFWNGNGEDCDGPLCHRMVFGLQGTIYYVDYALSYSGGALENYDSSYWDCAIGVNREGRSSSPRTADNSTTSSTPSGKRGSRAARKPHRQSKRGSHVPRSTTKAAAVAGGSGINYGGKDNSVFSTDRPVYSGYAYVINGIIFGLSGQTKEHWQSGGTFEWCMDFDIYDVASDGSWPGITAGLPWVTDKEMKMTFYKAPSYPSSYYSN